MSTPSHAISHPCLALKARSRRRWTAASRLRLRGRGAASWSFFAASNWDAMRAYSDGCFGTFLGMVPESESRGCYRHAIALISQRC